MPARSACTPPAEPAVLVVIRVALALGGADRTELPAGRHLRASGFGDVVRLAAEEAGVASQTSTQSQAETDAPAHLGDVVLRQVCIDAGGAALQAGEALVDAAGQQVAIDLRGARMRLQHLLRQPSWWPLVLLSALGNPGGRLPAPTLQLLRPPDDPTSATHISSTCPHPLMAGRAPTTIGPCLDPGMGLVQCSRFGWSLGLACVWPFSWPPPRPPLSPPASTARRSRGRHREMGSKAGRGAAMRRARTQASPRLQPNRDIGRDPSLDRGTGRS